MCGESKKHSRGRGVVYGEDDRVNELTSSLARITELLEWPIDLLRSVSEYAMIHRWIMLPSIHIMGSLSSSSSSSSSLPSSNSAILKSFDFSEFSVVVDPASTSSSSSSSSSSSLSSCSSSSSMCDSSPHWQSFIQLHDARLNASLGILNKYLFVFGGSRDDVFASSGLECVDIDSPSPPPHGHYRLLDMPFQRCDMMCTNVIMNGIECLLLVGGYDNNGVSNQVHIFSRSPIPDTTSTTTTQSSSSIKLIEKQSIGDEDDDSKESKGYSDDIVPHYWYSASSLSCGIKDGYLLTLDNHVLLFGGCGGDNTNMKEVYSYDPLINEWNQITSLPFLTTVVRGFVAHKNGIVVFGCLTNEMWLYRYDNNSWHLLPQRLNQPISRHSIVHFDHHTNVLTIYQYNNDLSSSSSSSFNSIKIDWDEIDDDGDIENGATPSLSCVDDEGCPSPSPMDDVDEWNSLPCYNGLAYPSCGIMIAVQQ